ncbi:MAG: amidohydrolase [Lysobacterales bacterium]
MSRPSQRVCLFLLLWACLALSGCRGSTDKPTPPQTVFFGGAIHPMGVSTTPYQAMVIEGERIVFLGTTQQAKLHAGDGAMYVELSGRTIIPGLFDAHLHPVRGSLKQLYQCNFAFSANPSDVQAAIKKCVAGQPDSEWIIGGQWDSAFFESFPLSSPRQLLDEVSGNKAVILSDDSLHNVWVNSRALELAGITQSTPDPDNGTIVRQSDGTPSGVLLETAAKMMREVVPEYPPTQIQRAIKVFMVEANAFGLTGIKDASTYPYESAGWQAVDISQGLSLHVATSLRSVDGRRDTPLDYGALEDARDRYRSPGVHTRFVKIFLDGVPTPARTAGMLAPYLPDHQHPPGFDGGPLLIEPSTLAADMIELDRRGFTVKIHAAGDRSVRVALDAIEAARKANGPSGLRHELAHAGYVSDADVPRFGALNAVADLSPILWYPSPIMNAIYQAVGPERGHRYFPVRDYLDSGAGLLAGSDWPAVAQDANPWVGIESLVTRQHPVSGSPQQLWPEQAITLREALDIYTLQGARALRLDTDTGSLEVGKLADFLILDEDLFQMPISNLSEIRPRETWFRGERVYSKQ